MKNSPSTHLGSATIALLAASAIGTGCEKEIKEAEVEEAAVCEGTEKAPKDLKGTTPTVTDLGYEGTGPLTRVFFDTQPFDPETVPGFEDRCTAWPLIVEVRVQVLNVAQDGTTTMDDAVLGSKEVWQEGDDSVDGVISGNAIASYSLLINKEIMDELGGTATTTLYESPSTLIYDFGPGETPKGE